MDQSPIKNPFKELEAFHQLAQLIFVSLDAHGRIRYINAQGSRMLGYEQEELLGRDWFQTCLPPAHAAELRSRYDEFVKADKDNLEFYQNPVLTRDSREKVFSWHNMLRRDKHGRITGAYATGMDITDLAESGQREQYLGQVLEYALNEIYIADADSQQLLYANKIAQSNIGYRRIIDLSLRDLMTPETENTFSRQLRQISNAVERSPRFECRLLRRDGSTYPVEAIVFRSHYRLSPVIVVYAQDISQRQQAQNQLVQSESQYQAILDTAAEGIITLNLSGEIESFNRSAERLFGYTLQEARGKKFDNFLVDTSHEKYQILARPFLTPTHTDVAPARVELQAHDRGGKVFPVEIAFARVSSPQALVTLVIHDLSQRKDAEAALRQREGELRDVREQLYHSQRTHQMNALANGIAHEINQPLAAINTYAETGYHFASRSKQSMTEVMRSLEQIGEQARRAGEIINSLRGMLKKHTGKREGIEFNNLTTHTIELIRPELKEYAIKVKMDSTANNLPVNADPVQIQQVLLNLLQNSVDSLKQVTVDRRRISVETRIIQDDNGASRVKCTVRDNGVGIPAQRQANIFLPFTTTKENGLGLGLTVCRDIINAHDGELAVNPDYTNGSEFYFTLPLHRNNQAPG